MTTSKKIAYKEGYKYQLVSDYTVKTDIKPKEHILTKYVTLTTDGTLTVYHGFAWDGPSGPTVDTKNFMRPSLIHDALYYLHKENYLPLSFREQSDMELKKACREDGMSKFRAWYAHRAVRRHGLEAATKPRTVHLAP